MSNASHCGGLRLLAAAWIHEAAPNAGHGPTRRSLRYPYYYGRRLAAFASRGRSTRVGVRIQRLRRRPRILNAVGGACSRRIGRCAQCVRNIWVRDCVTCRETRSMWTWGAASGDSDDSVHPRASTQQPGSHTTARPHPALESFRHATLWSPTKRNGHTDRRKDIGGRYHRDCQLT